MVMKTKRRLLKSGTFPMTVIDKLVENDGRIIFQQSNTYTKRLYAWQITSSEGHRWPKGRAHADVGGPFETVKSTYDVSHWNRSFLSVTPGGFRQTEYRGKVLVLHVAVNLSPWVDPEPSIITLTDQASKGSFGNDIQALGTKMISTTIPTNPAVDGSVGLAELFREGIPSMIGSSLLRSRVGFLRGLGSEYLNFEFGWKPLVSDVKNAARAIIESEKILQQLTRDSGKNVRRRRHLLPTKEVSTAESNLGYPRSTESAFIWGTPWARLTDEYRRDTWFSGCYTFEYDPGNLNEISKIAAQARLLYGLQLTPEVLWNLAPWSWLVDWFANVGPLLYNVSAFQNDQLVLRYGYVMDRHRRVLTQVVDVNPIVTWNTMPSRYKEVYQLDWKRRQQATPYGFGIASSSFTIRQWAILAALGITRGPSIP